MNKDIILFKQIIESQTKQIDTLTGMLCDYKERLDSANDFIDDLIKQIRELEGKQSKESKHNKDSWDSLANAIAHIVVEAINDEDD